MSWDSNSTAAMLDLDRRFLQTSLWPAIVYTIILMFTGTVGNILVLFVYRRHFHRNTTRMFIYALAILDLCNCIITMPAELAILIRFTSFPSPVWCKVSRYLTYIFNGTSSIVLIAIALDRYFKVCKPMNTIITVQRAKIICVASFFLTSILSIPALIIYGETNLPILVSENGVSILPLTGKHMHSFTQSYSLTTTTHSTSMYRLNKKGHTTESDSLVSAGLSRTIVYGCFCLLKTEHMDGKMPLVFYISMFIMYILMVILVVVFYGKVARTMFVLTSKHTKMFSFYSHRNCTPSSNSVVPEGSNGHFQAAVSDVVFNEISAAGNQTKGSSSSSPSGNKAQKDESKTEANIKHSGQNSTRGVHECIHHGNAGETGYETGETSSDSETRPEGSRLHQEKSSSKDMLINNCVHEEVDSTCHDNMAYLVNDSEQAVVNVTDIQETISQRNDDVHHVFRSVDDNNQKSKDKNNKKQKRTSKIPRIKVQKMSTEDTDQDQSIHSVDAQHPKMPLSVLSTNSLLRRRIKSAENLNHISRLQMLQVPDGRVRGHRFPDIIGSDNLRAGLKHSSRRENPGGVGHLTSSCVNLDYIADVDSANTSQEKTLTLMKTSSIGKKFCVLPLKGGMTAKTASFVRDNKIAHLAMTSSDKSLDSTKSGSTCKSHSSLELPQGHCNEKHLITRSTPGNLNSPDQDSSVTLRNRTPDIVKSVSQPEFATRSANAHVQIKTTRKEIVSTADILQEQHRRGSLHPFRTSRMLFVISLIFVISFLPFFIIALTRSSMGSAFMSLSETELGVLSVFIRSSFINNAANPIAYGFLSTHFRRECAGIMCCMFRHK